MYKISVLVYYFFYMYVCIHIIKTFTCTFLQNNQTIVVKVQLLMPSHVFQNSDLSEIHSSFLERVF
jgi:hypothetical protein